MQVIDIHLHVKLLLAKCSKTLFYTLSKFQTIPLLCAQLAIRTHLQLEGITIILFATFNNMYFMINDCLLFLLLRSNLRGGIDATYRY